MKETNGMDDVNEIVTEAINPEEKAMTEMIDVNEERTETTNQEGTDIMSKHENNVGTETINPTGEMIMNDSNENSAGTMQLGEDKIVLHPYCLLFPIADEITLAGMTEDIRNNGQREAITIYKGQVADGKNRLISCKRAGVEPRYEEYDGDEKGLFRLVVSKNAKRRHMTQSQKALIAARMSTNGNVEGATLHPDRSFTRSEVAKLLCVSERYVKFAAKLLREAKDLPELIAKVEQGKKSLERALKECIPSKPKVQDERKENVPRPKKNVPEQLTNADSRAKSANKSVSDQSDNVVVQSDNTVEGDTSGEVDTMPTEEVTEPNVLPEHDKAPEKTLIEQMNEAFATLNKVLQTLPLEEYKELFNHRNKLCDNINKRYKALQEQAKQKGKI